MAQQRQVAEIRKSRQAEASYALYQASQGRARACARRRRHGLPDAASHLARHPLDTLRCPQDSYLDRQKTGFVPVATNDRATLKSIQGDIAMKRPEYLKKKATKKVQYCAGQTAAVTPLLENKCDTIGLSKADQTNTQRDDFGNMNIGETSCATEARGGSEIGACFVKLRDL